MIEILLLSRKRKHLELNLHASLDSIDDNEDKLPVIPQCNEKVETDSLSMTTGIIPEKSPDNKTMWIPPPISTPDISPTNVWVMQQEKVRFQALAQGDERKGKMCTRVIDETTLRMYSQELLKLLQWVLQEYVQHRSWKLLQQRINLCLLLIIKVRLCY